MNQRLSRKIYRELINGNIINKEMQDGDLLVPNPLFDELALTTGQKSRELS